MIARKKKRSPPKTGKKDLVIRGGWVLTVDDDDRVLRADVRVRAGRIDAIEEKLPTRGVDRVIDATGMVVMPGLVQAHTHTAQTLFRGQPEGMDVLGWLRERIWPLEGAMHAADVRAACRLGMTELLLGGTTAILDMGVVRYGDVLFEEAKKSGIRYTGGKTIMDQGHGLPAGLRESTDEAITESIRLFDAWHGGAKGRLRCAFAPRFALSASDAAHRRCVEEARSRGALLHTHAAESSEEVALIRERTGMGNVEYLHSVGFVGKDVVLAHSIWLSAAERHILRQSETRVVHCPSANLKLASGIARVPDLLADGLLVALGSDGAACNDNLDGFHEMRLAALLHKARGGPGAIPAKTALRMATRNGALVLGLDDLGSIQTGMRADLVLLDMSCPHVAPNAGDLVGRVVFAARAADVHTVLVDGKVVVDEGELLTVDADKTVSTAHKAAARVVKRVD